MAAPIKNARMGGRKKGVPNKATAEIKKYAQQFGKDAIVALVEIAQDKNNVSRVAAIKELLNRAYGKSPQATEINVNADWNVLVNNIFPKCEK